MLLYSVLTSFVFLKKYVFIFLWVCLVEIEVMSAIFLRNANFDFRELVLRI